MFSAPDGHTQSSGAASPPPVTNPFQAPDFGEDDTFAFDDAPETVPEPGRRGRG
ncbi:hypothetical protein AB0E88_35220 [Streptomyces sp. NPDC028635]|uniref:hypothetical protein n=1 Tax=Streptomyces sp. NPDC028635 TaxID=3154800 RepID=UPI0033CDD0F1